MINNGDTHQYTFCLINQLSYRQEGTPRIRYVKFNCMQMIALFKETNNIVAVLMFHFVV